MRVDQVARDFAAIQARLRASATEARKTATRKFAPTAKEIYGVDVPVLNEIARDFAAGGLPLVKKLWEHGAFEERLLAAKMTGRIPANQADAVLSFVEGRLSDIGDWPVCDTLATQGVRRLLAVRRNEILTLSARLIRSSSFWSRRFGVVLLTNFASETALRPELAISLRSLAREQEPYVKKAMEWLSRDLAKPAKR